LSSIDTFQAVILGVVQGITEFLPISSSAHLILVSWFLGGKAIPLSYNVALHFGTLCAIFLYFWKDWLAILQKTLIRIHSGHKSFESDILLPALILGSFPVGLVGVFFKDSIESLFHSHQVVALPLVFVGFLLWYVDSKSKSDKKLNELTLKDGIIVGLLQVLALVPGVSRSGITIIGSRALCFNRKDAAKFSFLLGVPPMCGATLLHYKSFLHGVASSSFYLGVFTSAIVGVFVIKYFLKYLSRFGFLLFFLYRLLLSCSLIALS